MVEALEFALKYLEEGFSVIPIRGILYARGDDLQREAKAPLVPWTEYQRRRPTREEVTDWFTRWPAANLAIVTGRVSGIVVVDFDSPESISWAQSAGILETRTVRTARGIHAYYRYPDGTSVPTAVNIGGMKIDIRSDGGYVIAPPSLHADGTRYSWSGRNEIAPLPEVFLSTNRQKVNLKPLYAGVSEGSRNDSLARLCGSWVNDGLTLDECLEMARMWNERNSPPLPDRELERTVRSIFQRHTLSGRAPAKYFHEKNLLRLPIFTHNRDRIHREERITVVMEGLRDRRVWTVIPPSGYGLPGPFDEMVFMAIHMMICEKPKPISNPVDIGSLRGIARLIGYDVSGRSLSLIRDSIMRLVGLRIVSDRTFYDADGTRFITDMFGIFDRVIMRGEVSGGERGSTSTYIWLSPVYLKNINAGYVTGMDFQTYFSLRNPTARGIYRVISPLLADGRDPVSIAYRKLAERLQLKEEGSLSEIRAQLARAHRELVASGIFRRVTYRDYDGTVVIRYHRGITGN